MKSWSRDLAMPAVTSTGRDGLPISVGVADEQLAPLAFAAAEARLVGCEVRVVHAYSVPPAPPDAMGAQWGVDVDGTFRMSGRKVITDAVAFLAWHDGDVSVRRLLRQGPARSVLAAAATSSRLLVLGRDDGTPWFARLFRGRVTRAMVHDSPCPVVVVPDRWTARVPGRGVTLLLDGRSVAHGPLHFAFEQAALHHEDLRIVHVTDPGGPTHDLIPWHDMERVVDSWSARYPSVRLDATVLTGTPDVATVESFERTGLLVLGRPHEEPWFVLHEASLARSVVVDARCPVAVVPARWDPRRTSRDLVP